MLGIAIAQIVRGAKVVLTDLPEAQDIVERNISHIQTAEGASLAFQELDWDVDVPPNLQSPSSRLDLVIAADCTYNPDSR